MPWAKGNNRKIVTIVIFFKCPAPSVFHHHLLVFCCCPFASLQMLWNQLPVTSRPDHLGEAAFFLEGGTLRCWHLESYTRHIHWMCIQHHRELWNEDHQTKHLEKRASKNAIIHAPNSDNKGPSYVRFQLGKSYQKQCSPNKKQTVFSQQNTETIFSEQNTDTIYIS